MFARTLSKTPPPIDYKNIQLCVFVCLCGFIARKRDNVCLCYYASGEYLNFAMRFYFRVYWISLLVRINPSSYSKPVRCVYFSKGKHCGGSVCWRGRVTEVRMLSKGQWQTPYVEICFPIIIITTTTTFIARDNSERRRRPASYARYCKSSRLNVTSNLNQPTSRRMTLTRIKTRYTLKRVRQNVVYTGTTTSFPPQLWLIIYLIT